MVYMFTKRRADAPCGSAAWSLPPHTAQMAAARTSSESGQAAAAAAAMPPPTDTFPFAAPSARAPRWRSASHSEAHGGKPTDILERPRDKTRGAEVSLDALQFLFAEMVTYTQSRVSGIAEFERLLACMGYRVGERALAMLTLRNESASNPKNPRRETRLLPALLWVNNTFWKAVFGTPADSLERSTESGRGDECAWLRWRATLLTRQT